MLVYYSTFIFEIVFNNLYSNEGASTMYSGFSIFVLIGLTYIRILLGM